MSTTRIPLPAVSRAAVAAPRSARISPHSQNGSTPTHAPVASQETTAKAVGVTRNAARMLRSHSPSASAVTLPVTQSA